MFIFIDCIIGISAHMFIHKHIFFSVYSEKYFILSMNNRQQPYIIKFKRTGYDIGSFKYVN